MKIAACVLSLVNALPNVEKLGQVNPGQIDIDSELIMSGIEPGHLLMRRLPPAMFNCKLFIQFATRNKGLNWDFIDIDDRYYEDLCWRQVFDILDLLTMSMIGL